MKNIITWFVLPIIIIALYFLRLDFLAFFLSIAFLIYVIVKFIRSKSVDEESVVGSVVNSAGDRRLNAIIDKYTQPDANGKYGIDYVTCMGKSEVKLSPGVRAKLRTLSIFLNLDNKELKQEIKDILDERGVQPRQLSGNEARMQAIKTVTKGLINEDNLKENVSDAIKVNSFKGRDSNKLVKEYMKTNYGQETVPNEKSKRTIKEEDFDYEFAKSYRTYSKDLGDWEYNPLVKKEVLDYDEDLMDNIGEEDEDENVSKIFSF